MTLPSARQIAAAVAVLVLAILGALGWIATNPPDVPVEPPAPVVVPVPAEVPAPAPVLEVEPLPPEVLPPLPGDVLTDPSAAPIDTVPPSGATP